MSPHERRLILSPRAQDDLSDILQYTLKTWGEAQVLAESGINVRDLPAGDTQGWNDTLRASSPAAAALCPR
jgi:hypothetical protein